MDITFDHSTNRSSGLVGRRHALAPLDRVAEALRELGDPEFAYYARFLKLVYCGLAGDSIAETVQGLTALDAEVHRGGYLYPEPEISKRPFQQLLATDLSRLEAELAASEAELEPIRGSAETHMRSLWLMVLCVYERFDLALAQSEAMGERLFTMTPYVQVAHHTL